MTPPWIWLSVVRALTARPQSWTATTRSTRTLPVSVSTSTSANWAPGDEALPGAFVVLGAVGRGREARGRKQLAGLGPGDPLSSRGRDEAAVDGDRLGRHFPFLGRGGREAALGLERGAADRRRGAWSRLRAARRRAERHPGVSDPDRDLLERQAELLGGHDRDDRPRARSQILDAVLDLGRAVPVERHRGARARVARVVPDRRTDADAAEDRGVLRRPAAVPRLPADLLGADAELLAPDLGGIVLHAELERDPCRVCGRGRPSWLRARRRPGDVPERGTRPRGRRS